MNLLTKKNLRRKNNLNNKRNWIIGFVLSAAATFLALQTVNAPRNSDMPTLAKTPAIILTETPTLAYEGCSFAWAYKDEPALTEKLDSAIQKLNAEATAIATLFGENCVQANGQASFLAMETNFTIRLPVEDLTQYEEFGNWITNVMQIILGIPQEEIQGNYGVVEFWFEKNENEKITLRAPIWQYLNEAKDKSGVELFEYFYQP